ncbi:uncharacterized protein LOC112521762 [Cynara cardunculus var. scolymus]|uniref:Uncharacterized protein n=1 Tax=Cynara cardunculus var. scolymus TaxID=59895 RepID=A0A118JT99_CYNCS|nr:uncharacterized protein LOC112521762 [Cynara cardunculus var. scolymus]KVH89951.1 hypothetical protein Ccrd_008047 [Cynara cardunculus var. scolymus]
MASSLPRPSHADNTQLLPLSDAQSPLSTVVYELSQQVQAAMDNMLKMITEIDQSSAGIIEDIEKCKDSALERKRTLEEEKERFQKAAYSVLDMLNNRESS